jgi:hypothetical protein
MFVGKKQSLCESPRSHVKHVKDKVESPNFVLQRACDVIWPNCKLCDTNCSFKTVALWTWRHTGERMEIIPERSMEIKRVDEELDHIMQYLY